MHGHRRTNVTALRFECRCVRHLTAKVSNLRSKEEEKGTSEETKVAIYSHRAEWNHGMLSATTDAGSSQQRRPSHAGLPQLSQVPFVSSHKAQNNRAVDRLR